MDPNWQQYHDPAGAAASRRHNGTTAAAAHMSPSASQQQHPPPNAAYPYDQYHPAAVAAAAAPPQQVPVGAAAAPPPAGAPGVLHGSPAVNVNPMVPGPGQQPRDGNGDVPMRDALDSHAGIKYAMRPHHQPHMSAGRAAGLHSPHDQQPSAAAQRYSPMETLSPTSPYGAAKQSQFSGPPSQTQSPAGAGEYPQSPYYAGRPQNAQLPPMSPYGPGPGADGYPSAAVAHLDGAFANASKSPQRQTPVVKRVPEFRKLRAVSDLQPKNNRQPPFRRANPEGGFISVRLPCHSCRRMNLPMLTCPQPLQALTAHLPATYRICNPSFKYETSRNPRRVLTKPSKGVKNDGYDNEDSDYILYVNDILGSEEAGHKYDAPLPPCLP